MGALTIISTNVYGNVKSADQAMRACMYARLMHAAVPDNHLLDRRGENYTNVNLSSHNSLLKFSPYVAKIDDPGFLERGRQQDSVGIEPVRWVRGGVWMGRRRV
jgi:hypothetical protein